MNTRENRGPIAGDDSLADVRSSGFAITPPGGPQHPCRLAPRHTPGGVTPALMVSVLVPFARVPYRPPGSPALVPAQVRTPMTAGAGTERAHATTAGAGSR